MSDSRAKKFFDEHDDFVEKLKQCPLFDNMPDQMIRQLAPITTVQHFKPGDKILQQGQINKSIYFLMGGKNNLL